MDDIEALRAAAALLRGRAAKAPVGPWWAYLSDDHGTIVAHAAHPEDREVGGSCIAFFAYPDPRNAEHRAYMGAFDTAAYMALMNPLVAEPLAAWLDSAAVDAEQIGLDHRALAVARVLLGEQDPGVAT